MNNALKLILVIMPLPASLLRGAELSEAEKLDFFEKRIRPVIADRCLECHGERKQKGGLRLDSAKAAFESGDDAPVIKKGDPAAGKLIEGISYADVDFQMPPKGKLPDNVIADFKAWIQMGAPWPADAGAKIAGASMSDRISSMKKEHWAFQPIAWPQIPKVRNAAWVKTPIDAFVLAELEAKSIAPSRPAEKAALIRRAYYDLIGLPPSYETIQAFVNDPSPDAFEKVVDDLLANPHYGERWGRHWLDVARYADTRGYLTAGQEQRYAYSYTYRDWVVAALNKDMPFDQFVIKQIAADKLDNGSDHRDLAAMGFLTVGRRFINNQQDIIDDCIDLVGRGLMGLTLACSRCHDHKFDPVPTLDYYALYGIFVSSTEPKDLPLLDEPAKNKEYLAFEAELDKRQAKLDAGKRAAADAIANELRLNTGQYLQQVVESLPNHRSGAAPAMPEKGALRTGIVQQWGSYLKAHPNHEPVLKLWRALALFSRDGFAQRAQQAIARMPAAELNPILKKAMTEKPPQSMQEVAEIYGRLFTQATAAWNELKKKDAAAKSLPDPAMEQIRAVVFADNAPTTVTLDELKGLINRAEGNTIKKLEKDVEQWKVASPAAPPRAMVMVDSDRPGDSRIFIRGSAARQGDVAPRKFLSILSEVDNQHWNKGSGRLELAQAIASPKNPLTARVIVNRLWLWHFGEGLVRTPSDLGIRGEHPTHPQLLDWLASHFIQQGWSLKKLHKMILLSSTWRQSSDERPELATLDPENRLLWKFNRQRLDFESIRDSLLLMADNLNRNLGGKPVDIFADPNSNPRTLYTYLDRGNMPGLLRNFDFPSPDSSSPQRPHTTVPQQSLYLMNSPFALEQARRLAARKEVASAADPAAKVDALFRLALCRRPSAAENKLALLFIEQDKPPAPAPGSKTTPPDAWAKLAQALMMSNEFVFVD